MREIQTIDKKMLQINNDTLLGWVVWYCNDNINVQVYNSKQHDWIDLPKIGVQFMYRVYDTYIEQNSGTDYYCPYQLTDVSDITPWIKFGLIISQEKLNNIFEEVSQYSLEKFNSI